MIILLLFAGTAKIAFLHHANQSFSDNGSYCLKYGDYGYNGNSYQRILDTHEFYNIPVDFHISGTLLQSLAYLQNDRGMIERMRENLVDIAGGFYAEHIAPYVDPDMNHFALWYEKKVDSSLVKEPGWRNYPTVIWIPERVWKSEYYMPYSLIKVINDEYGKLDSNSNYIAPCIVLDDAAQWINNLSIDTRKVYKLNDTLGNYVYLVFISTNARNNMVWNDISNSDNSLHQELMNLRNDEDQKKVIVYGDDWEKAAGVAGWDFGQPGVPASSYDNNISYIASQQWIQPIHICEAAKWWGSDIVNGYSPGSVPELYYDQLKMSMYSELYEWTGHTYDNWYNDFKNTVAYGCTTLVDQNFNGINGDYEDLWKWTRQRLISLPDNNVSKLGWITMLAMLYETAWHTGPGGELIYWGKNLWNHTRLGGGFAYGSDWLTFCDTVSSTRIDSADVDGDGLNEYILYNNKLCIIFDRRGGRGTFLFSSDTSALVGNYFSNWSNEGDYDDGGHSGIFHDTQGWNSLFKVIPDPSGEGITFQEVYSSSGDSSWDLRKKITLLPGKNYLICDYKSGFTNWTKSIVTPGIFNTLLEGFHLKFIDGITDSGWTYGGYENLATGDKVVYLWGSGDSLRFHNQGRTSSGGMMMELGGRKGDYRFFLYAGRSNPEIDSIGPGDLEGPIIYGTSQSPEFSVLPVDTVTVYTHTEDPSGIDSVLLHYGINNTWGDIGMIEDTLDSSLYYAHILPQAYGTKVEYVIHSYDKCGFDTWDNNGGKNYSYTVGVIQFVMDGYLDRIAGILAENPDMHLWYYYYVDSEEIYVATEAAGDNPHDIFNNDHFIFVSSNPNSMVPAPWAKSGYVGRYDIFLADENDNDYSAWYNISGDTLPMLHRTGNVLEGVIKLNEIYDSLPESIYFAVGTYETFDVGTLQWQVPRPVIENGDIEADEFVSIVLSGIPHHRTGGLTISLESAVFLREVRFLINGNKEGVHIKFFDKVGRRVFTSSILPGVNGEVTIIPNIKEGIYFVRTDKTEKSLKFIFLK